MIFICDTKGNALTFDDDHILTAVNVFDMYQLRRLKGTPTICKLDVYGNLVICHAIRENPGKSIVNVVEILALAACIEFEIDVYELIWIEHTPKNVYSERDPEQWDRVFFSIRGDTHDGYEFASPEWKRISIEEVERLISLNQSK